MKRIAIVTGASSGLGKGFTLELDKRDDFDEFFLIAQHEEKLKEVSDLLIHPTKIFKLNLGLMSAYDTFKAILKEEEVNIRYLISAAGFGYYSFENDLSKNNEMIDVNIKGVINLTYLSIPYMHKGSKIVNVGSIGGLCPLPHMNVYGATKAFIIHWSTALNNELKPRGINVSCINPGWIDTNFLKRANITIKPGSLIFKVYPVAKIVKRALFLVDHNLINGTYGLVYQIENFMASRVPKRYAMFCWNLNNRHTKEGRE